METELTEKQKEQLKKQPIIENGYSLSEDGEWVIHRTTMTDIKSMNYLKKVLEREDPEEKTAKE